MSCGDASRGTVYSLQFSPSEYALAVATESSIEALQGC